MEREPVEPGTSATNVLERQIAGLDALEMANRSQPGPLRRMWASTWPVLAAIAIAIGAWELVVLSGWKPTYVLPGPTQVFPQLGRDLSESSFWAGLGLTMRRAVIGFALAIVVGVLLGAVVSRVRFLRVAFGSLITGLQTMPSIAWFPLAIMLFQLSESAILFVIVLGAAPSIANGLIAGVDYTPPILLRAGKILGLRGFALYRHLILPASLPAFVTGLKQGWAFAWRSLMAGELLVIIGHHTSLGVRLEYARENIDTQDMIAVMIVILVIGIVIDRLFSAADRALRRSRGLDPS
ncbi:ABC transporter permease [Actinoallomurus rhizosphaericola]|uniref:ABC transporter permease n=1 Tax=Actinoallomurus rhizosphaericola TaxID=2952536 RepID=UPI0020905738|nr:ABC transporter permease [Actinoallomurus rhizosphaericola]MCO5992771.1 ABC transporter permease [Actinoallomurus rhizosphaericola]